MQQLTVHIPDNRISFFMDLVTKLGFRVENNMHHNVLSDRQIELVKEASNQIKENPGHFMDWEEARKTLIIE